MKWLLYALVLGAGLTAAFALYVRAAPSEPGRWHVDPDRAAAPSSPNFVLLAGENALRFAEDPATVAAVFHDKLTARPRARRLAGDPDEGFVTYLERTALMAYPDYVSIKVEAGEGGGARVAVFSRSRFGRRDFGVNAARVAALAAAVEAGGLTPLNTPDM